MFCISEIFSQIAQHPNVQRALILIGLGWSSKLIVQKTIQISKILWLYVLVPVVARKRNWREEYGEWAVVTGSTDGIGKEFARQLASQGMNVVLLSRTLSKLNAVASDIVRDFSVQTKVIAVDFASASPATYRKIEDELSKLEVGLLINNVGMFAPYPMPVDKMEPEQLWNQISVNCGATTLMSRTVLPQMKERGKGAIVNISSGAAMFPMPLMTTYSASKIFVDFLSEGMVAEFSQYGIKILNLNTFGVSTNMNTAKPSFFIAKPANYVRSALQVIGRTESTNGYLPHVLQYLTMPPFPRFVFKKMIYNMNMKKMEEEEAKLKKN